MVEDYVAVVQAVAVVRVLAELRLAADLRLAHDERHAVLRFGLARQHVERLLGGRPLQRRVAQQQLDQLDHWLRTAYLSLPRAAPAAGHPSR